MDINLHSSNNKLSVSDAIFGAEFNEPLVHQVVVAYMNGARAGTKKQLTRAARPRAGTIRSPLWRHGGRHFAAVPRDHSQKVNRKMYRGAIRAILGELHRQGHLIVVESFAVEAAKTKSLLAQLDKIGANDILIVTDTVEKNLEL